MNIPKIRFNFKGRSSQLGFIEINGECIHQIEGLIEFYATFGYTVDLAKAGVLPEEFVWEKYIKDNAKYSTCLQIHLIDYLNNHSEAFRNEYGVQAYEWAAEHAKNVTARGDLCLTCKMQPLCSNHQS